ncbi:MAG: membrane-bound PQQ-dependent dehydrogenase, glucose/quinate/shikimate family [Rhodospirillum sp.]|nr:membrane-bound PQQ-dependent dehydrogenase, glucose/quinate/shikimate family [Rhodospirillum sp.]MCF8502767.1 membrane-bound PQQ-dependent dehydrogenase, glucose/quinate/shikimate family [Rhodospirillum sp.]
MTEEHQRTERLGGPTWGSRIVGGLFMLIGLILGWGGIDLLMLGGSAYYAVAALGLLVSGALIWTRRGEGGWLYLVVWAGTLVWALWEVGLDGWALVPRLVAPTILLLPLFAVLPSLRKTHRSRMGLVGVGGAAGLALVVAAAFYWATYYWNEGVSYAAGTRERSTVETTSRTAGVDWPRYGGGEDATRFSSLDQITPDNVDNLERAWAYHSGDIPGAETKESYSPENTPIKLGDSLYMCTAMNKIVALDPATGHEKWRYDPKVSPDAVPYGATCRGLAAYHLPDSPEVDSVCALRLFEGTLDGRLLAVDAKTGKLCAGFGTGGEVNLLDGLGESVPGWYAVTAPPRVVGGVVVVGAQVKDGEAEDAPSGVIRGYDAMTGDLAWAWDMGRPGQTGRPAGDTTYTRGTPNMWTTAASDEALGLVYLPMGNSSVDYWGGNRSAAENQWASSLVALDVTTGKPVWRFQTVHYDLWDYDLGSQPTLVDFPGQGGQTIPAIILPSKQGQIYILNRKTGESLFPVRGRATPSGGVEPENLSPTQPYSTYASVNQPPLTETDMWGMSPIDQMLCRIQFRRASYKGEYTPPTVDRPYIQYPGYNGGSDWGSVALDRERALLIVNYNDMPNFNHLVPRAEANAKGWRPIDQRPPGGSNAEGAGVPQAGAPYAIDVNAGWRMPTGLLCKAPPYGRIRAIDLPTGETVWDHPLGTARRNGPFGIPSHLPLRIGTPNNGGAVVTKGGLTFIAATTDNLFRAIDTETGDVLWEDELPGGGQANPISYAVDDQQYILISPGGHHFMETPVSDAVIAYKLP